jgi:hypothetical protein
MIDKKPFGTKSLVRKPFIRLTHIKPLNQIIVIVNAKIFTISDEPIQEGFKIILIIFFSKKLNN